MATYLSGYADVSIFFNLFRYLSFRGGGALLSSMLLSLALGPWLIAKLRTMQQGGTTVREDVPKTHMAKKGTPTMGGFLLLASSSLSILFWADLRVVNVWIVLLLFWGFGFVGFWDDIRKIRHKSKGISARVKLIVEVAIAGSVCALYLWHNQPSFATSLTLPFFKDFVFEMGLFYLLLSMFLVIGSANAVNLTDGLDGLATGPLIAAVGCFGLIAYLSGHAIYAAHLNIFYIPDAGELGVMCAALVGSCLGFLWFNAPPARIFMGDTGALSMGAALGAMGVITKHEIVLGIVGGVFVLETLSVIVQVASFQLFGKRVFAIAPLHHHFEQRGWSEATIVIRFWIVSILFALLGLATLKIR